MTGYILAGLALAALTAMILRQRRRHRDPDDLRAMHAWLESFSPDSYLPMLRLVDPRDGTFLAARKGHEEARRYQRMQHRFLKQYLRALSRDVQRLHVLAAATALRTHHDPEYWSLGPLEEKMEFAFSLYHIELCLFLHRLMPCRTDLRPLLANLGRLAVRARKTARLRLAFRVS